MRPHAGCQTTCVGKNQFQCIHENNQTLPLECIQEIEQCDGIRNCKKGEDEINCPKECPKGQFTCTQFNNRLLPLECIKTVKKCDGYRDCKNGSDEKDCPLASPPENLQRWNTNSKCKGLFHLQWFSQGK